MPPFVGRKRAILKPRPIFPNRLCVVSAYANSAAPPFVRTTRARRCLRALCAEDCALRLWSRTAYSFRMSPRVYRLEKDVKHFNARHRRARGNPPPQRLAPNGFDFQRLACFPILKCRGLVTSCQFLGALNVFAPRVALQREAALVCGHDDFLHQVERQLSKVFVAQNLGGVDSTGDDRQSIERNIPDQFSPTFECEVVGDPAFDFSAREFCRHFVRALLGAASEFAENDVAICVTLDLGFRMSIDRDETKSAKDALGSKVFGKEVLVTESVLQRKHHRLFV